MLSGKDIRPTAPEYMFVEYLGNTHSSCTCFLCLTAGKLFFHLSLIK